MKVKHKAKALAIRCIDFRFQEMIKQDLIERGLKGKFDNIAIPGVSKNLKEVVKYAKVSLKLHDPDQVLIYEHQTCGAYGENDSKENHRKNAQKLSEKLKMIKPDLEIVILFATQRGIENL